VGKSTAGGIVHEVVQALKVTFVSRSIVFPVGPELDQVMKDFEALPGLPQCAGAIDGCFIKIERPSGPFGYKYWCYKGHDAILLLGVVDARGIFTYVHVGNPGSVGDSGTFHGSTLELKIQSGTWLSANHSRIVEGINIRPFLVADAAFTFQPTVMKAFGGDPVEGTKEHAYNYSHVRTRRVVEQAFGRLKGRFHVLKHNEYNDPDFMSDVTLVCCALHNLCERHMDPFEDDWWPAESNEPTPVTAAGGGGEGAGNAATQNARHIRNALATARFNAGGF
jgi:hypothetical protein